MSKNNGGLAFPLPLIVETRADGGDILPDSPKGMTMRQYYKAAALQGILAMSDTKDLTTYNSKDVSMLAADFADAMIAEDEEYQKP